MVARIYEIYRDTAVDSADHVQQHEAMGLERAGGKHALTAGFVPFQLGFYLFESQCRKVLKDYSTKMVGKDESTKYPGRFALRPCPSLDGKSAYAKDRLVSDRNSA
jgi:hypothetical protein